MDQNQKNPTENQKSPPSPPDFEKMRDDFQQQLMLLSLLDSTHLELHKRGGPLDTLQRLRGKSSSDLEEHGNSMRTGVILMLNLFLAMSLNFISIYPEEIIKNLLLAEEIVDQTDIYLQNGFIKMFLGYCYFLSGDLGKSKSKSYFKLANGIFTQGKYRDLAKLARKGIHSKENLEEWRQQFHKRSSNKTK